MNYRQFNPDYLNQDDIISTVNIALSEDLNGNVDAAGDITAALIAEGTQAVASVITRESMTFCGQAWAQCCFTQIDPFLRIDWKVFDGQQVSANTQLFSVSGSARSILTAERSALNFIQTLSSTATMTHHYARILMHTNTQLLDTRKTLPGLRNAQKYAVLCGGGSNHRIGLYDAFLIKENHISACGGIAQAVSQARAMAPDKDVEVEVESLDELDCAINAGADIVMLDNFSLDLVKQAVALSAGRCKLEVSGNITEKQLKLLAATGVNYISSGALTKHINAVDLSLRLKLTEN